VRRLGHFVGGKPVVKSWRHDPGSGSDFAHKEVSMPRYLIERTFPDGLSIPMTDVGARICRSVINANAAEGVTWVHSYVNAERTKTFCIYDAPNPEAIRKAAKDTSLPIDTITEVSVLDPYFYRS
jgi:hypothetical protein